MQFYPFSAMLARMKYISRWGLMRSSRTESLCEHTADTALLAHTLALISVSIYGTQVRCETVCVAALYHDASEILTGDMPTPVKYKTEPLRLQGAGAGRGSPACHPCAAPGAPRPCGLSDRRCADGKRAPAFESRRQALSACQVHGGGKQRQPRIRRRQGPADGRPARHAVPGGGIFPRAYASLLCLDAGRAEPRVT